MVFATKFVKDNYDAGLWAIRVNVPLTVDDTPHTRNNGVGKHLFIKNKNNIAFIEKYYGV